MSASSHFLIPGAIRVMRPMFGQTAAAAESREDSWNGVGIENWQFDFVD